MQKESRPRRENQFIIVLATASLLISVSWRVDNEHSSLGRLYQQAKEQTIRSFMRKRKGTRMGKVFRFYTHRINGLQRGI
jgi:hypothetical protein